MNPINTKNCQLSYKALRISNEILTCLVFGILILPHFVLLSYSSCVSTVSVGGTLFYKIVSQSLYNEKLYGGNDVETKALQAKISKMEEEITECKKLIERAKIHKPFDDFKLENISSSFESNVDEKTEDVIGDFMNFWMI